MALLNNSVIIFESDRFVKGVNIGLMEWYCEDKERCGS